MENILYIIHIKGFFLHSTKLNSENLIVFVENYIENCFCPMEFISAIIFKIVYLTYNKSRNQISLLRKCFLV